MSMHDKLHMVAPPPSVVDLSSIETVSDFDRILALPRREPYICDIDPKTGRYPARTQALIEVETAKFSRGTRISCGCKPRKMVLGLDGRTLTITRVLSEKSRPEAPIVTTRQAFAADNRTPGDAETLSKVMAMEPGQEIDVPPVDGTIDRECIIQLAPAQAWFLREAAQEGGAVGFMGVGSGKSICFLLAPLIFTEEKLAVLLIEPKQRQHYRSQYLRLREHFRVSSIVSDVPIKDGTVPGTVPLHLISFSVLSRTDNSDKLDDLSPGLFMIDEGHRACGTSAINRRAKRYCTDKIKAREEAMLRGEPVRSRAVHLLTGSGTLEVKSVNDTQMLCAYSLGTTSPLPLHPDEAEAWSFVMDTSYRPDRESQTAQRLRMVFGDGKRFDKKSLDEIEIVKDTNDIVGKTIREGFQKWRTYTPGIISASASDINAAIYVDELETPPLPKVVADALARVRVDNLRPDGQELEEKMEQLACAKNVGSGFYTYWAFPKHPCTCPKDEKGEPTVTGPDQCPECLLIEDWYAKRKRFEKEKRSLLLKGFLHLDSDKNCELAAERARLWGVKIGFGVFCNDCLRRKENPRQIEWPLCDEKGHKPAWHCEHWAAWREIKDRVEYEERVRWIGHDLPEAKNPDTHPGYFLARFLAQWAKKNKAVIWFQSVPLGRKIAELSGLPYFNGGPGGEDRLRAEKGDRSIIVSISAHGASTDGLQDIFDLQALAEVPPSNATTHGLEQIFGRLHRRGQKKDVVTTRCCLHIYEFKDALRKAIQQAWWNREMGGLKQKILLADIAIDDL